MKKIIVVEVKGGKLYAFSTIKKATSFLTVNLNLNCWTDAVSGNITYFYETRERKDADAGKYVDYYAALYSLPLNESER